MSWVRVTTVAELPEGESRTFQVGDFFVALCKVEGRVFALDDLCPHDMGPLGESRLEGHEIICPRHGARFDVRDGRVLCFPAYTDIRTFPVRIEGDDVEVDLG